MSVVPASRLREICDLLEITPAELARKSGVSDQTIKALLKGKHPPSWPTAVKIAEALGAGSVEAVFPVKEMAA